MNKIIGGGSVVFPPPYTILYYNIGHGVIKWNNNNNNNNGKKLIEILRDKCKRTHPEYKILSRRNDGVGNQKL